MYSRCLLCTVQETQQYKSRPNLGCSQLREIKQASYHIAGLLELCGRLTSTQAMSGRKEGNVLFNDALNTFYFYGYMPSDI